MALFNNLFKGGGSKKEKVQEPMPLKKHQFNGLSIGKILWAGFLVIAIITLLSAYSSYLLYAEKIDDNHNFKRYAIAERAAAVFAAKLEFMATSIERILAEKEIQDELSRMTPNSITPPERLHRRLNEQLHLLLRQVVIGPDTAPNSEISPPLSYACLALPSLKRPTLELHRFATADQHLDIAFPLSDGRSLLLSFDTKLAQQWLNSVNTGESYIVLQQQIGEHSPLTFGKRGSPLPVSASGSTIKSIPGTQFQVTVSLPKVEPLTQTERVLYFANFAIALLLIILTLTATLIAVRLILKKDLQTIGSLIDSPSLNMHHILPIKLAELRGYAETIKRQFGIEKGAPKTKVEIGTNPPPFSTSMTVDVELETLDNSKPTGEKN